MRLSSKLRELYRERYEWGEIERDAAELRQFSPAGGWFARFWSWIEGKAREGRLDVDDEIREVTKPVDHVNNGDGHG